MCCRPGLQVVTIIHVVLVVFIIIAGFVKSNPANLRPFAPFGARGIFNGAAIVFFRCVESRHLYRLHDEKLSRQTRKVCAKNDH